MTEHSNLRTGGQILVDQLQIHGVDMAFGVPGESYLGLLDALFDSEIRYITCRQESGATNGCHGVHIARQDSTPMILLIGQVARETRGREAFQEIDQVATLGGLAKWAVEPRRAEDVPAAMAQAVREALTGRPGPVLVSLPEDLLDEIAELDPIDAGRLSPARATPDEIRANQTVKDIYMGSHKASTAGQ